MNKIYILFQLSMFTIFSGYFSSLCFLNFKTNEKHILIKNAINKYLFSPEIYQFN